MSSISSSHLNSANALQSTRNTPANNEIRVDGTKISWPNDGWYEVQSATSYNTISEGGRSATLPHGTYNLINHTTGERFENISVPSATPYFDSPSPTNSSFAVQQRAGEPLDISIPTLVGDVNITVTPEDEWSEIAADSAWDVGSGIGLTIGSAVVTGGPVVPTLFALEMAGDVVNNVGSSTDIDASITPNKFSMAWRFLIDLLNPRTPNPLSTTPDTSNSEPEIPTASATVTVNGDGTTSTTVSTPDATSTSSPVTNVTTTVDEEGTVIETSTTVTTPTGMTIGPAGSNIAPEPTPPPTPTFTVTHWQDKYTSSKGGDSGSESYGSEGSDYGSGGVANDASTDEKSGYAG